MDPLLNFQFLFMGNVAETLRWRKCHQQVVQCRCIVQCVKSERNVETLSCC